MSFVLILALSLAGTPDAAERRPMGASPEAKSSATIALKVGAAAYDFTGQATCEHLDKGSIYDVVAERWSVEQQDGSRNLHLNVWKPVAGGENLISLFISTGGKRYEVNTTGPTKEGSGTILFAPEGKGGTFTIKAKSKDGATISGTVKCTAFSPAIAVAGN